MKWEKAASEFLDSAVETAEGFLDLEPMLEHVLAACANDAALLNELCSPRRIGDMTLWLHRTPAIAELPRVWASFTLTPGRRVKVWNLWFEPSDLH